MSGEELELFELVDSNRSNHGCAPLRRNSSLSAEAGSEATERARTNRYSSTSAGGRDMTAAAAYNRLLSTASGTLLNCNMTELGIGHATARYCNTLICIGGAGMVTRHAWAAEFGS